MDVENNHLHWSNNAEGNVGSSYEIGESLEKNWIRAPKVLTLQRSQ